MAVGAGAGLPALQLGRPRLLPDRNDYHLRGKSQIAISRRPCANSMVSNARVLFSLTLQRNLWWGNQFATPHLKRCPVLALDLSLKAASPVTAKGRLLPLALLPAFRSARAGENGQERTVANVGSSQTPATHVVRPNLVPGPWHDAPRARRVANSPGRSARRPTSWGAWGSARSVTRGCEGDPDALSLDGTGRRTSSCSGSSAGSQIRGPPTRTSLRRLCGSSGGYDLANSVHELLNQAVNMPNGHMITGTGFSGIESGWV